MSHQLWHYDADTKRRESIPSLILAGLSLLGCLARRGCGETTKSVTLSSLFKEEQQNEFSVAATIPEPETYAMLELGIALLGVAVRRRNMI
jgi:hypothetical protein